MIARYSNNLEIEEIICRIGRCLLECSFSNNECKFIMHSDSKYPKEFNFNSYGFNYTDTMRIELLKTVINMIKYDCELSNIESDKIRSLNTDELRYVYKYGKVYDMYDGDELIKSITSKHLVELDPIDGEKFLIGCNSIDNGLYHIFSIIEGKEINNMASFSTFEKLSHRHIECIYKITKGESNLTEFDSLTELLSLKSLTINND